jgi:hypothetical protein
MARYGISAPKRVPGNDAVRMFEQVKATARHGRFPPFGGGGVGTSEVPVRAVRLHGRVRTANAVAACETQHLGHRYHAQQT